MILLAVAFLIISMALTSRNRAENNIRHKKGRIREDTTNILDEVYEDENHLT